MLPGVRVSAITQDGSEVELGQTDKFGTLGVPKSRLRELGARFILFSCERFFSGVLRVESTAFDFYAADERYIQLATFAVL